jgi:hypothetical protein
MSWYDYLNFGLLLLIWGVVSIRIKREFSLRKWWLLFLAIYTLTEMVGLPLSLKGINNLWIYNISKPIQYFFLLLYFDQILKLKKKYFYLGSLAIAGGLAIHLVFDSIRNYNSLEDLIGCIIVILCSVVFFSRVIKSDSFIKLDFTEFWFVGGLFIFFGISFCISGALYFLIENEISIARKLFYVLIINSVIFYLLILYALVSYKKIATNV